MYWRSWMDVEEVKFKLKKLMIQKIQIQYIS